MKQLLISIIFLILISFPSFAEMGVSANYGFVNNFAMFEHVSSEVGSSFQVGYLYKVSNFYTLALEIGFVADSNLFKNAAVPTYSQAASYLNIKNYFYLREVFNSKPYFSIATALNGVKVWRKEGGLFYSDATNIFADINLGVGADFKVQGLLCNFDLNCPAILHVLYSGSKMPAIFSFGVKHYLSPAPAEMQKDC